MSKILLPVSEEEVRAAENAETAFRDVYDSSEQAAYSTDRVPVMLRAAHAVLVPRIERALEEALHGMSPESIEWLRAAFWRAMEEKAWATTTLNLLAPAD